jgi:hypothetical protein
MLMPFHRKSTKPNHRYLLMMYRASSVVNGTPTPAVESIVAQASAAYDAAVKQAGTRFTRASGIVSGMIQGTPKPIHEKMHSSVEAAYSDSVASASKRLEAAIAAASGAATAAKEGVEDFASSVSSAVESNVTSAKDEL